MTATKAEFRSELRQEFKRANKLWKILEIALADEEVAEGSRGVRINMAEWYHQDDDVCSVCLAGSVIRRRLADVDQLWDNLNPEDFDEDTEAKLYALNALRRGDVVFAHAHMFGASKDNLKARKLDRVIYDYHFDTAKWHKEMNQLLADLKKANI